MSDDPKDPRHSDPSDADDSEDWLAPEEDEEAKQWQRPVHRDRFPSLPDEETPAGQAKLKEPPRPRPASGKQPHSRASDLGRNLVTLFFVLASCGVLTYFVLIWQNPYSSLNPLAPPTPIPMVITATYTPTFTPTASPMPIPSVTLTPSPIPSEAPTLTFTPVFFEDFSTPGATEDPSTYRFALQNERVIYITNPAARGGCNWSSIAGSVMNYDGSALNGYGVHVVGEGVDETVSTGTAPGFGPGGFEVPLGSVARDAQFAAQLLDLQGTAVSPVYTVETNSDCELNIAALRFVETEPSS
jgi:hypothetical protein